MAVAEAAPTEAAPTEAVADVPTEEADVNFNMWGKMTENDSFGFRFLEEKEVASATSLCYYLPHENKCKRIANTNGKGESKKRP